MQPKRFASKVSIYLLLALSVVLTLCKKNDYAESERPAVSKKEQYFAVPASAEPIIYTVAAKMQQQNAQSEYISSLSQRAGVPQWHAVMKAQASSAKIGNNNKNEGERTAYFIPFVKEGTTQVTAALMVKIKGADTTYKMIYRQHYLNYGFAKQAGKWDAETVFMLFANLEEKLFGYTAWIVNDGRIMGGKKEERFRVRFSSEAQPDAGNKMAVTICKTVTSCVLVGGEITTPGRCTSKIICETEYVGSDDVGSSGGGGGGGYTTQPAPDQAEPCPSTPTAVAKAAPPADGGTGGGTGTNNCNENAGWQPENIENEVKDPCLNKAVNEAISKNVDNEVSNFMKSAFGTNPDLDLVFKDADLGFGTGSDDGITNAQLAGNFCRIIITLNSRTLPYGSKEYTTATIFHEALHAWIILTQSRSNSNNSVSHETMAKSENINLLANSIKRMHPNISMQSAIDLAWGGLQQTSAWQRLTEEEKARINQTNYNFSRGKDGSKCP